jgi:hypothetical protein
LQTTTHQYTITKATFTDIGAYTCEATNNVGTSKAEVVFIVQGSKYTQFDKLTRRMSLVEQEMPTFPEHMSSPSVLVGFVFVTRSLVLCVCFVDRCLSFCTFFLLAIVLSVLLRYTDSDYPFCIFKLFLD